MKRISRSMTRFRPLLSIPKYANGAMVEASLEKQATETVTSGEEHEDHERDDQRHRANHRQHRRALVVHRSIVLQFSHRRRDAALARPPRALPARALPARALPADRPPDTPSRWPARAP